MQPTIFIASSSTPTSLTIANTIQASLEANHQISVWNQDNFDPGDFILDGLFKKMVESDFGVFVFHPDDEVTINEGKHRCVRDNVVFETGLFIGAFGKNRCFIVTPRPEPGIRQISDLGGLLTATYDPTKLESNAKATLGNVCREIERSVKKLGPRASDGAGSFIAEWEARLLQQKRK